MSTRVKRLTLTETLRTALVHAVSIPMTKQRLALLRQGGGEEANRFDDILAKLELEILDNLREVIEPDAKPVDHAEPVTQTTIGGNDE